MSTVMVDTVHPAHIVPVEAKPTVVKCLGTPVYYKEEPSVSATNNTGELLIGETLSVGKPSGVWFIAKTGGALLEAEQASIISESQGSAITGTDGTIGGPGGSPLSSSVVSRKSHATEGGSILEPYTLYPEDFAAEKGVKAGEDYTTVFQAMIDKIVTEGWLNVTIRLGEFVYNLNSAPRSDRQGNAILALPEYKAGQSQINIRFEGIAGGSHFATTVGGQSYSAEHGAPAMIGGPTPEQLGNNSHFANVNLEFVNVSLNLPANPTLGALELARIGTFGWENLLIRSSTPEVEEPSHPCGFGVHMPEGDNSGVVAGGQVHVTNLYAGIIHNAHLAGAFIFASHCVIGVAQTGNEQYVNTANDGHSSAITYILTQECKYHRGSWSPTEGAISIPAGHKAQTRHVFWDIEDQTAGAPKWFSTTYHLLDANNQMFGGGPYARVEGVTGAVSGPLTVLGGANFELSDATLYRPAIRGGEVNETVPLYRTAGGSGIVLRPESESTQGSWDFIDEGKEGYAEHIVVGQNCTDVALFGIGVDYSTTGGILISCKAGGFGLSVANNPGSTGIGLTVTGWSAKASPARYNMQAGGLPIVVQSLSGAGFADGEVVEGELSKLKSATAKFVSGDTGAKLEQLVSTKTVPATIQAGTTITFVNSTTVTLSKPALRATTGLQFSVSGRLPTEKTVMVEVVTAIAEQWWLTAKKAGDGFPGFVIRQGGQIDWGAGVTTNDVFLKRGAEGSLRVGSATVTPSLQVGTEGVKTFSGKGAPGTLTGQAKGDVYFRSDGGTGTRMYFATSTTAWEAVAVV